MSKTPYIILPDGGSQLPLINMIEEKRKNATETAVLNLLLDYHKLTYKTFSKKIGITTSGLRKVRAGDNGFKMSMRQVKTLQALLKPLGLRLEELPDDWLVEKKTKVAHSFSNLVNETILNEQPEDFEPLSV